jgi:hypothetical protein
VEPLRDLAICQTDCHQPCHLDLAPGESLAASRLQERRTNGPGIRIGASIRAQA